MSSLAVARVLGIELLEPPGWTCCGATAGHQTDRVLAASLSVANLLKVQAMDMDLVANCAACYNRMKVANHDMSENADIRRRVADAVGMDYDGTVKVRHFVEILLQDIGLDVVQAAMTSPLGDMKVAPYYGCLLVRPPEVTQFDDPENPKSIDRLVEAMGAVALDWPHKLECCGGGLSLSRTDVVVKLTDSILSMAKAAGAECMVVACPMCQVNLDLRQLDIKKKLGHDHDMPILYITQLLGLAMGIAPEKLGLNKLMISPDRVVKAIVSA